MQAVPRALLNAVIHLAGYTLSLLAGDAHTTFSIDKVLVAKAVVVKPAVNRDPIRVCLARLALVGPAICRRNGVGTVAAVCAIPGTVVFRLGPCQLATVFPQSIAFSIVLRNINTLRVFNLNQISNDKDAEDCVEERDP